MKTCIIFCKNLTKHKCFILGEFNFELLDSFYQLTKSFTDIMFSFNYYPLINKPTRITENKLYYRSHLYQHNQHQISSGINTHSIADHLPIIQISVIGELTYHEKNVIRCFTPKYL